MTESGRWGSFSESEKEAPPIDPALAPYINGVFRLYGLLTRQPLIYEVSDGTEWSVNQKKNIPKGKKVGQIDLILALNLIEKLPVHYPLSSRMDMIEDLAFIHDVCCKTANVKAQTSLPKEVKDWVKQEMGERPLEIDSTISTLLEDRGINIYGC